MTEETTTPAPPTLETVPLETTSTDLSPFQPAPPQAVPSVPLEMLINEIFVNSDHEILTLVLLKLLSSNEWKDRVKNLLLKDSKVISKLVDEYFLVLDDKVIDFEKKKNQLRNVGSQIQFLSYDDPRELSKLNVEDSRVMLPWVQFFVDKESDYANLSADELKRKLASDWNALPDEERNAYFEKYDEARGLGGKKKKRDKSSSSSESRERKKKRRRRRKGRKDRSESVSVSESRSKSRSRKKGDKKRGRKRGRKHRSESVSVSESRSRSRSEKKGKKKKRGEKRKT